MTNTVNIMSSLPADSLPVVLPRTPAGSPSSGHQPAAEVGTLIDYWNRAGAPKNLAGSPSEQTLENCLAQVRLGMASSLFIALRCKHGPTASHSLRVALGCAAWATALGLPKEEREAIEVAALLHDVGKIGVADRVLLKPGPLTQEEAVVMDRYRQMTVEILTACCASPLVLELAANSPAWYDGSRPISKLAGEDLPLGARLISIVNAFDAMTCGQIYRPALSHERAVKELFAFSGTQFDPRLVQCFAELRENDLEQLHRKMAGQWLQELDGGGADACWQLSHGSAARTPLVAESLFQQKLLDNMVDAVVFLDNNLQITLWNNGAERLTGIESSAVQQRTFRPSMLEMRNEHGSTVDDDQCPVAGALQTGGQSLMRLNVRGQKGRETAVDAHIMPVVSPQGILHGVTLVLHDASPEASLEERCQRLHEKAIRDPLTQVANRAEFDRVHGLFVETHQQRGLPCSLIICDIDRFKLVNDNYGHPAGDEVIKSFAQLLKGFCRPGDLVARYGGEEFVLLFADCGVAVGFQRAEQIRRAFGELSQPALGGQAITASFGITETQSGDTAETMLNRADRALLTAKESGRNMVIQLGSGGDSEQDVKPSWWQFWKAARAEALLEQCLVTAVPLKVAIEKLRGFVADQKAEVASIKDSEIVMLIHGSSSAASRRQSDRPVPMQVELSFAEEHFRGANAGRPGRQLPGRKSMS